MGKQMEKERGKVMIELDDDLELQDLIDMEILCKLQDSLHSVLAVSYTHLTLPTN